MKISPLQIETPRAPETASSRTPGPATPRSASASAKIDCHYAPIAVSTSPVSSPGRPRPASDVAAPDAPPPHGCVAALPGVGSYGLAMLATGTKTFAWWFNQFPQVRDWSFAAKWAASAGIAGAEYLPLTAAMTLATKNGVHVGLMTASMEATDNVFRMLQQQALGKPLAWYDWTAAGVMVGCVGYQAVRHYHEPSAPAPAPTATEPAAAAQAGRPSEVMPDIENNVPVAAAPDGAASAAPGSWTRWLVGGVGAAACIAALTTSFAVGDPTSQAYTCATLATGAKTFAWWINQYPALESASFLQKWGAGWGIAAVGEYLPLIGAMTIASENGVHLGLMTAYMEVLDNALRMAQQKMLGKPLTRDDYVAACGMAAAVVMQGALHVTAG